MNDSTSPVSKRWVFYIPGYDPMHPRRYRELYKTESKLQADISGYEIAVSSKKSDQTYGWNARTGIEGAETTAKVDVLIWSDIVRDSMKSTIFATYLQLIRTSWVYIVSGTLRRLMWMRKGPVVAAIYPVAMLLLQLFVAMLAGWMAGTIASGIILLLLNLSGLAAIYGTIATIATTVITILAGVVKYAIWVLVVIRLLRWFKAQDGKIFAYYLMHDYAFSAQRNGVNPPVLEKRMAKFADQIAQALTSNADEVLVVGHSSGATIAVSVLADLIRDGRVPPDGPKLALLSLGQVIPMMSFLPKARRLRTDLAFLSKQDALTWVDVSAPADGCSFALCDPVAVTGVAPQGKRWPLIVSAAFSQTLSKQKMRQLRGKYFKLHFQYLCAFDQPKDYDYFQITAGPLTLADRYRGRQPSKSRIDVVASKYQSIDP